MASSVYAKDTAPGMLGETDVNPCRETVVSLLPYQLVKWQFIQDDIVQDGIVCGVAGGDVCGFTSFVLAAGSAADSTVEDLAPVTGCHHNRMTESFTERVKDVIYKRRQVFNNFFVGGVVNVQTIGGGTSAKLLYCKVFHFFCGLASEYESAIRRKSH